MRNVTSYSVTLLLAAALAVPGQEAQAQARVVASVASGSLFDGAGFGFGVGAIAPESAFFGVSLGVNWADSYGYGPYGIYSDTYDGWQRGYRGHRAHPYATARCRDPYWDPYWDPWYDTCFAFAPIWAPSWGYAGFDGWGFGFAFGHTRWYGPRVAVYVADPFATPWGPYWSYDPWGGYWNRWGHGYGWDRGHYGGYGGYGDYRGTRVVYGGGHSGWGVYRPSPLFHHGPTYVEDPTGATGATGRTAHRRETGATSAAPQVSPRRPVIQGNPEGIPGWGRTGITGRTAQPRGAVRAPETAETAGTAGTRGAPGRVVQPSDRVRSPAAAPGTSGRTAQPRSGVRTPSRGGTAPAAAPATARRPSGNAPATRTTQPAARPTDRLPGRERVDRPPVRAQPRSGGTGGYSGYGSASRARSSEPGSIAPSGRFSTAPSRFAAPRGASRSQPPSRQGVGAPTPGSRTVAPMRTRSEPTRVAPTRSASPRPTPAPRARSAPASRASAPRASAPRPGGGVSRRAPPPRRGGGGGL